MNDEIDLFGFGCVMLGIGVESAIAIIDLVNGQLLTAALPLAVMIWLSVMAYRTAKRRQR